MRARCAVVPLAVLIMITVLAAEYAAGTQPRSGEPQDLKALAEKSGCLQCHSVDKKVVGPAFRDIGARYKQDIRARDSLKQKIKTGGKGNWTEITGGVPMPPHSALLSETEIAQLVEWILGR